MLANYICEVGLNIKRDEALEHYRVKLTPRFEVDGDIYGYVEGERTDIANYLENIQVPILIFPDPRYKYK